MERLAAALLALLSTADAHAAACAFDAARQRFETLLAQAQLPGGAMLLGNRDGVLYERYFGLYDADTVVPIASASKWLSALRIVQLAEQGRLDLDAPVSDYLPQFTGIKGTMTVAQMFSHTSGYGDDSASPIVLARTLTLAQAVDHIACCLAMPDGWAPGQQFAYGGISMHVAGRVAEVVGGGDWQAQWLEYVARPLHVSNIDYEAFGDPNNYVIAGSAQSSLRDYGRVLHALVDRGWSDGARVLAPGSVAAMFVDRVGALPVAYAPDNATPPVHYGLGHWIEGDLHHSLGAFGFFPFVRTASGTYGVFMIRGPAGINDVALPAYRDMLAAIDTGGCDPVERPDGVAGDGFEAPAVDLAPP